MIVPDDGAVQGGPPAAVPALPDAAADAPSTVEAAPIVTAAAAPPVVAPATVEATADLPPAAAAAEPVAAGMPASADAPVHAPLPSPVADARAVEATWRDRLRRRVLERVAAILDGMLDRGLAEEDPPEGLADEVLQSVLEDGGRDGASAPDGCDLYTLWSAVTALTQEVKLEGRSFRQLSDTLSTVGGLEAAVRDSLASGARVAAAAGEAAREARDAAAGRDAERASAAAKAARREVIDALLDARDGLARGAEGARAHLGEVRRRIEGSSWFARRRLRAVAGLVDAAEALEEGCAMALARVDDLLLSFGVEEIDAEGAPFDPRRMRAADVESTDEVPEGTVLQVYRSGYAWDGEVVRPCEVRVSRGGAHER